jgi:LPXTG-motif cell wall-anchored protein
MKKFVIGATAMLLSVAGFSGLANAYPPDTTTTIIGQETPTTTGGIPRTGGDIDSSLVLGASAVALGAGMVLVTRRRRRPQHS